MSEDFGTVDRRPLAMVHAANLVSIAGNCLTYMGVPWFVLQSTGSAARAGLVAFCTLLPAVLAALVTGPVIDRMGRRRVSVASDLACGVAVAAIPLLQFWMLCVLMAMTGLFRAPGETARGVLVPTLAERAGMPGRWWVMLRRAEVYTGFATAEQQSKEYKRSRLPLSGEVHYADSFTLHSGGTTYQPTGANTIDWTEVELPSVYSYSVVFDVPEGWHEGGTLIVRPKVSLSADPLAAEEAVSVPVTWNRRFPEHQIRLTPTDQ
ncbi:hypothetical protein QFZ43_008796 [Streptomyces afghaniensis]|nr:hypothetical protein [Streptomyces afghaniensis]